MINNLSELQKKDLKYVFHPCAQMKDFEENPPLVIKKGDGLYLIDENGNRYMDCISSWWVNLFGHCNERINKVITEQVNTLEHVIFANFAHEPAAELCEELTKVLPNGLNKFLFSDNGSSCIEMALKLSFQYHLQTGNPQKTKFISLENAYHGETIGALGVGDVDIFTETYRPLIKEGIKVRVPYINTELSNDEFKRLEDECIKELEDLIVKKHNEIACMIVEPMVQGAAGIKIYSARFLKAARELTKKYNIHLIDDEIAMGFGRTGKMFACEHAEIEPDIICIAKGLSSGYYPIAILCITTDIFKDKPYVKDIRNIGLIGAIELKDNLLPNIRVGKEIYNLALKKGVFVRPIGNSIYFMPPYIITYEEINKMLQVCKESIEELLKI